MVCIPMRIQPHPDRGPPTTAVLRALDTVTNVLAPSHKSRFRAASYTPLAASGQNPRYGTHHGEVCRGCLVLCALGFGLGRSALFERECRFWRPGFYLKLRPYMKPHAGLAPTHTYQVTPICHMAVAMRHVIPAFGYRRREFPQPEWQLEVETKQLIPCC